MPSKRMMIASGLRCLCSEARLPKRESRLLHVHSGSSGTGTHANRQSGFIRKGAALQRPCWAVRHAPLRRRRHDVMVMYAGHQRWVWDCVFSVDGAYLVTGKSSR